MHALDVALFREQFPVFADDVKYPDAMIQMYWDMACCYVDPTDWCLLAGSCLQLALNLMTAHLVYLAGQTAAGSASSGVMQSATVDKVSVTVAVPPIKTAWQQWLAQSPYGLQLWALLTSKSAGGFMVGGYIERQGFRKAGGVFG